MESKSVYGQFVRSVNSLSKDHKVQPISTFESTYSITLLFSIHFMKNNQLDVATKEVKLNAVHADPVRAVPKKNGQVSIPLDDDDDDDQLVDVSKHESVLPESDRVEEEEVEVEKVEKSKLVTV